MADNVSPETGSETADLSIEDILARRAPVTDENSEAEAQEQDEINEQDAPTDDADEAAESDEDATDEEGESASEEDAQPEAKDDVLIKMDDGSTVTVAELKAEASTLKTENARILQEASNERREVQQYGKSLVDTLDRVSNYLASKLPPEPENNLLWTDPARHHQMTYLRQAAIAELQSMMQVTETVKEANGKVSEADVAAYRAAEKAALIKAVPNLKDEARYKAAMDKTKAYLTTIGFDKAMIDDTHDAKMLQVAMDAAYGKEAREAAAKAKVQVKAVTANKPVTRTVHPNSMQALKVQNVAKRAQSTGSIDDVLALRMARMK